MPSVSIRLKRRALSLWLSPPKQHRPALASTPANHPNRLLIAPFTHAPCPNGTPYTSPEHRSGSPNTAHLTSASPQSQRDWKTKSPVSLPFTHSITPETTPSRPCHSPGEPPPTAFSSHHSPSPHAAPINSPAPQSQRDCVPKPRVGLLHADLPWVPSQQIPNPIGVASPPPCRIAPPRFPNSSSQKSTRPTRTALPPAPPSRTPL
jgi:hypothetical protein